jgi:acetylglutamate kinase
LRLVIKIGGALLDDATLVERCARCVAGLVLAGDQVAVVHGGGKALTRLLERLGKKSEFVHGLRVTDAETRDAALMVLAGGINKKLVGALGKLGQPAIGMCGGDGLSFRARKCVNGGPDLGFVGEISAVDPHWLNRCVIRVLPAHNIAVLREAGIITGGMLPKLEACERALAGGVGSVHILPGAQMEALKQFAGDGIQVGTELIA